MTNSTAPGWYQAQGDPPGTERFWDGSSWTDGPRPLGGAPEASMPMGAPMLGIHYQETSKAATAIILVIFGGILTVTGYLAPIGIPIVITGMVTGSREAKAIDQGRRDPSNRSTAKGAVVLGWALFIIIVSIIALLVTGMVLAEVRS